MTTTITLFLYVIYQQPTHIYVPMYGPTPFDGYSLYMVNFTLIDG